MDYRLAKASDIPSVAGVFATAIDDVNRKHGFLDEPTSASPPDPQYAFCLRKDPGAFWVAEDRGHVVGYSLSFLRGSLWFLGDLFVRPEWQGKGIGGALIERTLGSWSGSRKITNMVVITPAFNMASVSLYMRHGMLPRQPLYFARATREAVAGGLVGDGKRKELELKESEDFGKSSALLDSVHRRALGFPAGWHNEFFFDVLRSRCLIFRKRGRPVGYSFVRSDGRVGPLVMVKSAPLFAEAFDLTLRAALEGGAESIRMFFAGTNGTAVRMAIRCGFRIEYPQLFLSSRPTGDFQNYLFYSPGLM